MRDLIPGGKRAYAAFLLCATTAIALPEQTFTMLHSFNGTGGNGPVAALVQANNGDLYGTTYYGGNGSCQFGCGTLFEMAPNGRLTTLHDFCSQSGCTDGSWPAAALVQASDGNLYGLRHLAGLSAPAVTIGAVAPFSESLRAARSRRCTASTFRTANSPSPHWFRTPTEHPTGPHMRLATRRATARSSASLSGSPPLWKHSPPTQSWE